MARGDAGKLRTRITLQTPTPTPNDTGGQTTGWDAGTPLWAQVRALQGQEALMLGALQGAVMWSVTIRYRTGVTPKQRVVLADGSTLLVTSVIPVDDRKVLLRLMCTQERAGATA